jgi:hypothetical protein
MIGESERQRAVETSREFVELLDKMAETFSPDTNVSMKWILKDKELVQSFLTELRELSTPDEVDDLWLRARDIPRLLGCSIDDPLAIQYGKLRSRLYQDILDLVTQSRTANQGNKRK